MVRVLMLLYVIIFSMYTTEQTHFLQENFITKINEQATTWKAGMNFDPSTPKEYFLKLLGSKRLQIPNKIYSKMYKIDDEAYNRLPNKIPSYFDAREKWKHCSTIGKVRDQGHCGSCWAFSTSSAFADRLCVATNGDFNESLSAEEITFCCPPCGDGCNGGYPIKAWEHFEKFGLVTGGDYKSSEGCEPYRVAPCPYNKQGNRTCASQPIEPNHKCAEKCYGNQDLDLDQDHRYTLDYYYLTYGIIQKDVMTYGPIEMSFDVYDDFLSYKSGVYVRSKNASFLGGHSVKLIGWGEENGIPYWLLVNSWNSQWGDKGLFKIRRGTNECGIDNSTTGGVPAVANYYNNCHNIIFDDEIKLILLLNVIFLLISQ
ncbi:cathepsin B-like cysteine proteinase 5 [Aphis gossypii]|uniref:cathepsin B-like cysteine proteinase 5 n=1 Tax=Aphis gossypii TaxID=80765 RepID=UPI0021592E8A|nr:cathepsin B-like cysteine proteinase 5 [Aphis gossypii]